MFVLFHIKHHMIMRSVCVCCGSLWIVSCCCCLIAAHVRRYCVYVCCSGCTNSWMCMTVCIVIVYMLMCLINGCAGLCLAWRIHHACLMIDYHNVWSFEHTHMYDVVCWCDLCVCARAHTCYVRIVDVEICTHCVVVLCVIVASCVCNCRDYTTVCGVLPSVVRLAGILMEQAIHDVEFEKTTHSQLNMCMWLCLCVWVMCWHVSVHCDIHWLMECAWFAALCVHNVENCARALCFFNIEELDRQL